MSGAAGGWLLVEDFVRAEAEQERAERAYRDMLNAWLDRRGRGPEQDDQGRALADRERARPHCL